MSTLVKNAISFLQKRFPVATVLNHEYVFSDRCGNEALRIWPLIAQDSNSGIKQRAIAINNLGSKGELLPISKEFNRIFQELDGAVYIKIGNAINPTGHEIDTNQMTFAPRIILYTNKLCAPFEQVIQIFNSVNLLIDIVDESTMHKTLFISYGGPDESVVVEINKSIKSKGVKTWFFPDDAQPGAKLHRTMHEGVNNHDHVLLVCSETSLSRPGVLNEIERILEREAKEGGVDILIPVTLDDYVFSDWAPDRKDIADQIRSRVITKLDVKGQQFESSIEKIVNVLRK